MRRLPLLSLLAAGGLRAGCAAATDLMNTAATAAGAAQTAGIAPVRASWETTADQFRSRPGVRVAYDCPSGGSDYAVWGTDVYSDDSSVCTAAVHAGLITFARGGRVVVQIRPGQDNYSGTTHNGVQSSSYGSWEGSVSFAR